MLSQLADAFDQSLVKLAIQSLSGLHPIVPLILDHLKGTERC